MINPQDINPATLPWLPLDKRSLFPQQPALYFAVTSGGTIQYIGLSKNLRKRWICHHRYKQLKEINDVKIAYLLIDGVECARSVESALITRFSPPLNVIDIQCSTKTSMGLAIATLRKQAGLTQKQLTEKIGCGEDHIAIWESGRKGERLERSIRLCQSLGCESSELESRGVRSLREEKGLTQKQVASLIGSSERTVISWESGQFQMEGLNWVVALCQALECITQDLLS